MIRKRIITSVLSVLILITATCFGGYSNTVNAASGWNRDSKGWYYMTGSSYYASTWAEISGSWYYFTADGYMDYSEYRDGCWLESNGAWNPSYSNGKWNANSVGWWYSDASWYPVNQWLWIDGCCYYFDSAGYMESNCYRDGCWIEKSGAWNPSYSGGRWHTSGGKYWFEDNGWYPKNQMLKIDGVNYWFDSAGYLDMDKSPNNNGSGGNKDSNIDVTAYSYKVTPLLPPFNEYFFIETDNPDYESFRLVDKNSKYGEEEGESYILPCTGTFEDVIYTDKGKRRVGGGYIASAYNVDGGELVLQYADKHHMVYDNGASSTWFDYYDTNITVNTDDVVDNIDYLIQNYKGGTSGFFEEMSSIQEGFNQICLYSGAYVLGDLKRGNDEWGISDSPHIDQNFYIQDPYYRNDNKDMFVSDVYPYIYDSIGFPRMMCNVADRLGYDFTAEWSSSWHDTMDFTYNGETRSYGGAGHGGGQGIRENMIKYFYTFDGSAGDAGKDISLSALSQKLNYYGGLIVEEEPKEGEITWADIRKTVGKGSYVKIYDFNNESKTGFTYMYDNNANPEFDYWDWGNIGRLSYMWYDGRYFNGYEMFEKGIKFGDTSVDGTDTSHATIILEDGYIPIPQGHKYSCIIDTFDSLEEFSDAYSEYDLNSKTWRGYMEYVYDRNTGNWVFGLCNGLKIYNEETGKYENITDPDFVDACTITPEEMKKMNIDANSNKDPVEYYSYDTVEKPGTYHNSKTY